MELPEVIIESHIPFVGDALEGLAHVRRLIPGEITPEAVKDADALIVRTRTRCDATLLEGSRIRFVGTATIGTDHIDGEYCRSHGITTASAPGCNAPAVAQYIWSSILTLRPDLPAGSVVGVVGLGHVGSIVAAWGKELGMEIMACDPPRAGREGGYDAYHPENPGATPFHTLEEIARRADVITFHTPHTKEGPWATHHLADSRFFDSLERQPIVANAARGPIIDSDAFSGALKARKCLGSIIDCWENEPAISGLILSLADIATPHIAGYSLEGKKRATGMALRELLRHIAVTRPDLREESLRRIDILGIPPRFRPGLKITRRGILDSYNPLEDTAMLKAHPEEFEALRNNYNYRPEV